MTYNFSLDIGFSVKFKHFFASSMHFVYASIALSLSIVFSSSTLPENKQKSGILSTHSQPVDIAANVEH